MFCRRTRIALAGVVSLLLLAVLALALLGGAGDASAQGPTDYDTNNNGLIDVTTLAQLNAIRYDLDGSGAADSATDNTAYAAGYPNPVTGMGCPGDTCTGYELRANLDFDTSGNDDVADAPYANWTPIGTATTTPFSTTPFTATFDGNDHTIANLAINLTTSTTNGGGFVGLFGDSSGTIRDVGLVDVNITNTRTGSDPLIGWGRTGGLAGRNNTGGTVSGSYVTGSVTHSQGAHSGTVGCLVGYSDGTVSDSYAACDATALGALVPGDGGPNLGGLVGYNGNSGTIRNSYATGSVTPNSAGRSRAGGLAGQSGGTITSSYATGNVAPTGGVVGSAQSAAGGLVGAGSGNIIGSWASGNAASAAPEATVGGLVGRIRFSGVEFVRASYATGDVSASGADSKVGGLIGNLRMDPGNTAVNTIYATYATGAVANTGGGSDSHTGGLVGRVQEAPDVVHSYWNSETSGQSDSAAGEGKTTAELRRPTSYAGIYANWNVDLDNADGNDILTNGGDDPWDFGTAAQYPVLKYDGQDICQQGRVCLGPVDTEEPEAPPIIYNLNIRFDARRIALPEGHTASYRVRLAGPPSGSSKISIRSDNPDVSPSPAELTFTAANWNQWQTVKISIAGDANSTDESATLAHYGPNRGYGSVLVSVTDTGDSRQAGDTTPPALTVVTEPGARWGVTVGATVPADLAADGVVRVSSAYGAPRTATGYSLGRNGVAQAIVSIAGPADVPASGLTVCLPVARALADEAGERTLTLLRYADAESGAGWQAAPGAEYDAVGRRVCAGGVTEFGAFASAYVLPQ